MMNAPTPRLALTLLGLFFLGLAALAIAPFTWSHVLAATQEVALHDLTFAQRRAAAISVISGDNKNNLRIPVDAPFFLSEPTHGIAGAALQARLNNLVSSHGGIIDVVRVLPIEKKKGLSRIAVTASLRVDLNGLQAILHKLESGQPFLAIEQMVVSGPPQRPSAATNSSKAEREELQIKIQVAGFAKDRGGKEQK